MKFHARKHVKFHASQLIFGALIGLLLTEPLVAAPVREAPLLMITVIAGVKTTVYSIVKTVDGGTLRISQNGARLIDVPVSKNNLSYVISKTNDWGGTTKIEPTESCGSSIIMAHVKEPAAPERHFASCLDSSSSLAQSLVQMIKRLELLY